MEMYNKINSLLKERGATKKNMCDNLSISYNSLMSMFNRQSKNIALGTIQAIADYLEVTVDYLIRDEITNIEYGKNTSSPFIEPNLFHAPNSPTTTDTNENELLATYRELNTDNQAYIRVRADELLKGQLSTEETKESDTEDIKTFKIASRNGKNEIHLTKEQRKILAEAIDNSINNREEKDLSDLV